MIVWYLAAWAVSAALLLLGFTLIAYTMARYDFCFTRAKEGTAKMVVKGDPRNGRFDHALMWWRGHYFNDPRRYYFDPNRSEWEVLENTDPRDPTYVPSAYAWWELHWKWLEMWGVYWFGLTPFKNIYVYKFKWTEKIEDSSGAPKPWHREEDTSFIYVNNFPYWVKLAAAEDLDNEQLDLDYLLTIEVNNPVKALFDNDDWLARTTADANNASKMYVGRSRFDDVKREMRETTSLTPLTSPFADSVLAINDNSVTQAGHAGSTLTYGVTIRAVSLVAVTIVGDNREEVTKATTARIIAERYAQAAAAKALGEANAMRIRAQGQADAIDTVYSKITDHGDAGLTIRTLEALENTANSPSNTTTVWANNPVGGLATLFDGMRPPKAPTPTPTTT